MGRVEPRLAEDDMYNEILKVLEKYKPQPPEPVAYEGFSVVHAEFNKLDLYAVSAAEIWKDENKWHIRISTGYLSTDTKLHGRGTLMFRMLSRSNLGGAACYMDVEFDNVVFGLKKQSTSTGKGVRWIWEAIAEQPERTVINGVVEPEKPFGRYLVRAMTRNYPEDAASVPGEVLDSWEIW